MCYNKAYPKGKQKEMRYKKMKVLRRILSVFFGMVSICGLLLIAGTAGGVDHDALTLSQAAIYMLCGLAVFFGSGYVAGLLYEYDEETEV